ncbi:MAG: hypothetical protein OEZ34_04760 [Spirochaetia bacterium]|nr:hypothetical protein [Spirochaetia bacterium]
MLLKQTIHLFLDSIGRSEEYEYYLDKFRSESHPVFSILCPDLDSFRRVHRGILFDIQFLQKLELYPALILTGPFADEMADYCREAEGTVLIEFNPEAGIQDLTESLNQAKEKRLTSFIYIRNGTLSRFFSEFLPAVSGRIHFIRMAGSIRDPFYRPVFFYNLKKESESAILHEDLPVIDLAKKILLMHQSLHVSVTSPVNLLKEIFTVKGAGTVIRKGSLVVYKNSLSVQEVKAMEALLEKSFQKKLKNRSILEGKKHYFIEENFSAAAILEESDYGMYLTKFAVDTNARGSGIAQEIWDSMISKENRIFWRAKKNNSVNRWYLSLSDGVHKSGDWFIFWKGVGVADIPNIVQYCIEREEDFEIRK